MIKQNKLILKPVVQFAVAFAAMVVAPVGGGQNLRAEVLNLQQSSAIKGSVVDENNEPVIGATILVLGSKNTKRDKTILLTQYRAKYLLHISILPIMTMRKTARMQGVSPWHLVKPLFLKSGFPACWQEDCQMLALEKRRK